MAPPDPKTDLKGLDDLPLQILSFSFFWASDPRAAAKDAMAKAEQITKRLQSTRTMMAAKALEHRKSLNWTLYGLRKFEGPEGADVYNMLDNKCNLFVYEMLAQAGVRVPLITYETRVGDRLRPPLAGEWANPRHDIPGFEVLTVPPDVPQPGDIAAIAHDSEDATGHVGIVVNSPDGTPNWTMSARKDGVVHEDWGFRGQKNAGPVVFRRYVGGP